MIIAVASGKGGTGKTTVAVNLACVCGTAVHFLDCDVEEPNAHLFLKGELCCEPETVSIPVPEVDELTDRTYKLHFPAGAGYGKVG